MKVWVTLGKEVLAEVGGNTEWVVGEGGHQYQQWPHDQFQNEDYN